MDINMIYQSQPSYMMDQKNVLVEPQWFQYCVSRRIDKSGTL